MPRYEQAGEFFWTIDVVDATVTTSVGKIGNAGHTRAKSYGTSAAAEREAKRLVAEKLEQGYTLVTSTSRTRRTPR